MHAIHAFALLAIVTTSMKGCPSENHIHPLWEPSILERLGCDEEDDAAALPEDRPVAVCDVSKAEIAPIYERATFLGVDSYDPNGNEIIDYHWAIVEAPEGSAAAIGSLGPIQHGFVPDLVGTYTMELVVTNDQCVTSDPCQVSLEARPAEDLWVEMYWEKPGDDMDLHLVRGDAGYESDDDCYFGNCIDGWLDWGREGTWQDDPALDLDDIPGTGPENINILDPVEDLYTVVVHDYPGSVLRRDNDVTVKIYLGGELVWTDTRTISGEDTYTEFAAIAWPSMDVHTLH